VTHPSENPATGPHPHCRVCCGTGHYRSSTTNVRVTCNCPDWATRPLRGDTPAVLEQKTDDILLLRARVTALEDTVTQLVRRITDNLNAISSMLETPAKENQDRAPATKKEQQDA
jgi:hypothetical protein